MKNAVVGQSGGPTAVINATLSGVIEQCFASNKIGTLYGAVNGIDGILSDNLMNLNETLSKNDIEILRTTPGAYLGSCRKRINEEDMDRAFEVMKSHNIGYFFYIGGNDSMDTVAKLSVKGAEHGVQVIGVPKTIDNDLCITDHCPGFGSAAKYIATSVMEITRDCTCYDLESVTIIEIMGRNAGWLAASSVLARCNGNTTPDLIYLPERPFTKDKFIADVKDVIAKKKSVVVAISEGIRDESGEYISKSATFANDTFGHSQLGGAGKVLENLIKEEIGCKARAVELNLSQRCASHLMSETDMALSVMIGRSAVKSAEEGKTAIMMAYKHTNYAPFTCEIEAVSIEGIANSEKKVPDEFITTEGNGVTGKFIEYAAPLIAGEVSAPTQSGMPVHLIRKS